MPRFHLHEITCSLHISLLLANLHPVTFCHCQCNHNATLSATAFMILTYCCAVPAPYCSSHHQATPCSGSTRHYVDPPSPRLSRPNPRLRIPDSLHRLGPLLSV